MMMLLYLTAPLADAWFIHPPEAMVDVARPLQFGLVAPLLIATLLCSIHTNLHAYSTAITAITLVAIGYCSMQMRLTGNDADFEIATDWINVTTLGAFFFTSMRVPVALGVGLCLLTMNIHTEIAIAGAGGLGLINMTYELESMAVIFALGLAGCYIIEVNSRLTWLEAYELEQRLDYDALTGALNRNRFRNLFRQRYQLAAREHQPICVALVDIDHFKAYNDRYGHNQGDACLIAIGRTLNLFAEANDALCARLGGEEFALVFFADDPQAAKDALEQLRAQVQALNLEHEAQPHTPGPVTVSIGGLYVLPDGNLNRFDAIRRADEALYQAKAQGRNCVVTRVINA